MRRETTVAITREGRDQGKSFNIRELPAAQAEEWFSRAIMLLVRAGVDMPPNIFDHGAAGFAAIGIGTALTGLGKAPWFEVKPLLDEMMGCLVSFNAPGGASVTVHSQIVGQIEEVATIIQLREEIVSLHLGFSLAAKLSAFRARAAEVVSSLQATSTSGTTLQ